MAGRGREERDRGGARRRKRDSHCVLLLLSIFVVKKKYALLPLFRRPPPPAAPSARSRATPQRRRWTYLDRERALVSHACGTSGFLREGVVVCVKGKERRPLGLCFFVRARTAAPLNDGIDARRIEREYCECVSMAISEREGVPCAQEVGEREKAPAARSPSRRPLARRAGLCRPSAATSLSSLFKEAARARIPAIDTRNLTYNPSP